MDQKSEANRTRAFIARNIHSCPKKVKAACYTTLVRPMMEYATTAWVPQTVENCNKLEQVQRRAARFACHRYERAASVTAMMNDLKWESLETRRNNQRLTTFYRMQHNMMLCWLTWCLLLQLAADHLVPVQQSYSRRSGRDWKMTTICRYLYFYNVTIFSLILRSAYCVNERHYFYHPYNDSI